jgi:hypothetical protein
VSIARVTRPAADATQEQARAYYREVTAALEKAGVGHGEEFVVCPVSVLQGKLYNTGDDPAADALGAFSGNAPDTSRKAALDNYPRSGSQRLMVLEKVMATGLRGLTRDDISVITELPPNVATPRVKELVEGGWLDETDRTRKTRSGSEATVLIASQKALQERSGDVPNTA